MVGIVIVNYNTWEKTIMCIDSIEKTCNVPYHIYAVDNCSTNCSLSKLQESYNEHKDVSILASDRNGGYGYGLTFGSKVALADGCDAIIMSNNDIIYLEDSIKNMYEALKRNSDAGIICAQQLDPKGERLVSAIASPDTAWSVAMIYCKPWLYLQQNRRKEQYELFNTQSIQPVFCPVGGCYMFRTTTLEQIGFYDTNIFLYCEENIIGKKMERNNYKTLFLPDAKVIHEYRQSTGNDSALRQLRSTPSIFYYGCNYLAWNKWQERVFKINYYTDIIIKSIYRENYRKSFAALFKIFTKET